MVTFAVMHGAATWAMGLPIYTWTEKECPLLMLSQMIHNKTSTIHMIIRAELAALTHNGRSIIQTGTKYSPERMWRNVL